MNNLAPIALFTYNRPSHTRQTIEALAKNDLASQSKLFVFSDGAKSSEDEPQVEKVRQYLNNISGFHSTQIIRRDANSGLSRNIIDGVTWLLNDYESVIVLEDDLETHPNFLRYMNHSLKLYAEEPDVVCIHGYVPSIKQRLPETFFIKGADCWGWATWKRGWEIFNPNAQQLLDEIEARNLSRRFNFNNSYHYTSMLRQQVERKIDSWAIRWYASAFLKDKLTLYPNRSFVKNIGFDGSGRHCSDLPVKESGKPMLLNPEQEKIPIIENEKAYKAFVFNYRCQKLRWKLQTISRIFKSKCSCAGFKQVIFNIMQKISTFADKI
ncbi:MAG: glycosyltransferase [Dysgonamonadaceae bacterium]|jgi:hypothetical protein|nr:glycosyltransferase [Dysgonamonadaceae bacterium]